MGVDGKRAVRCSGARFSPGGLIWSFMRCCLLCLRCWVTSAGRNLRSSSTKLGSSNKRLLKTKKNEQINKCIRKITLLLSSSRTSTIATTHLMRSCYSRSNNKLSRMLKAQSLKTHYRSMVSSMCVGRAQIKKCIDEFPISARVCSCWNKE